MIEIFKDIVGWEGQYQVSNLGRVKSIQRVRIIDGHLQLLEERILNPHKDKKGYCTVNLYRGGISKQRKLYRVHRLVAQAFLENPDNLPIVNHKDEDPSNNTVDNLEWCDNDYNLHYGTAMKRAGKAKMNHPKLSKPVLCVETGIIYPSTKEVQRKLGFSATNISCCCRGKYETKYGYHWRYVE